MPCISKKGRRKKNILFSNPDRRSLSGKCRNEKIEDFTFSLNLSCGSPVKERSPHETEKIVCLDFDIMYSCEITQF
jgi:hypothetical protein